jgi:hypothetical protein
MDFRQFEEALVDFFCRQFHDVEVARSRAQAIIHIAQGCDEEIIGAVSPLPPQCPFAGFAHRPLRFLAPQKAPSYSVSSLAR